MPLFLYIDRSTFLHRLHPIVKVLGMLCFFIAAFVSQQPAVMLPIAAGIVIMIVLAHALPNVRRLRLLFALVFAMTFIIWALFFRGGEALIAYGPLSISAAGLRFALGMAIKLDEDGCPQLDVSLSPGPGNSVAFDLTPIRHEFQPIIG